MLENGLSTRYGHGVSLGIASVLFPESDEITTKARELARRIYDGLAKR
jgi:hypothetical protein